MNYKPCCVGVLIEQGYFFLWISRLLSGSSVIHPNHNSHWFYSNRAVADQWPVSILRGKRIFVRLGASYQLASPRCYFALHVVCLLVAFKIARGDKDVCSKSWAWQRALDTECAWRWRCRPLWRRRFELTAVKTPKARDKQDIRGNRREDAWRCAFMKFFTSAKLRFPEILRKPILFRGCLYQMLSFLFSSKTQNVD